MTVLKKFSDDELAYDNYLSRLDREREQRGLENYAKNMEAARDAAVAALQEGEARHAEAIAQAEAHAAQAEAHAAQAEAHAAQAEAHAAQAEAQAAQTVAQAAQTVAQAAQTVAQAEVSLREARQQMRQTLQTLYTARFGAVPAALAEALESAPLATLTAWLPLFASASASEIQALIPSDTNFIT